MRYIEKFEIIFYDLPNGTEPVKEFLLSLDIKMRAKMLRTIALLGDNGYAMREPYSKPIDDGIFELRAQVDGNISRVLYFFIDHGRIILTNGFIKKTGKTPSKEIELARKYRREYLSRR